MMMTSTIFKFIFKIKNNKYIKFMSCTPGIGVILNCNSMYVMGVKID